MTALTELKEIVNIESLQSAYYQVIKINSSLILKKL